MALTIADFDPSGGAGVLADLKTFSAHECYGVAVITSMTAQNTREIRKLDPVDSGLLRSQIEVLFEDVEVAGIKIGLLGSKRNLEVIGECLEAHKGLPVVVDPVFHSSNGKDLTSQQDLERFRRLLFPFARVITPSAEEAGRLLGIEVATLEEMKGAAKLLHEQGIPHVIITGGHLDKPADVYYEGQEIEVFTGNRTESQTLHGTGCTLSSAILANLLNGKAVKESVVLAKAYVSQAIARAYPIGAGRAPLNHLFRFGETPVRAVSPEALYEGPHR